MKIITYPANPEVESARRFVTEAFHTVHWENFKTEIEFCTRLGIFSPNLERDVRGFIAGTLRRLFWEIELSPVEYLLAAKVLEDVCVKIGVLFSGLDLWYLKIPWWGPHERYVGLRIVKLLSSRTSSPQSLKRFNSGKIDITMCKGLPECWVASQGAHGSAKIYQSLTHREHGVESVPFQHNDLIYSIASRKPFNQVRGLYDQVCIKKTYVGDETGLETEREVVTSEGKNLVSNNIMRSLGEER